MNESNIVLTSLKVRDDLLKKEVSLNKLGLIDNAINLDNNYQIFYTKIIIKYLIFKYLIFQSFSRKRFYYK